MQSQEWLMCSNNITQFDHVSDANSNILAATNNQYKTPCPRMPCTTASATAKFSNPPFRIWGLGAGQEPEGIHLVYLSTS